MAYFLPIFFSKYFMLSYCMYNFTSCFFFFHLGIFPIELIQLCICVLYFSFFGRNSLSARRVIRHWKSWSQFYFVVLESFWSVLWKLFWNYFVAKKPYVLSSVCLLESRKTSHLKWCLAISCPTQANINIHEYLYLK